MREQIVLYVNGRRVSVSGHDAFLSLSQFLRERLRLTGTKVVCSEGDCGSCSVLVGRLAGNEIVYRAVDSCIQLMFQLDGTHVVTVEGLKCDGELSPVQQTMVELHGSQCGYCTPGFVVAMTGLLEHQAQPSVEEWRCGLTGNLCRCTGYASILAAGERAASQARGKIEDHYPAHSMITAIRRLQSEPFFLRAGERQVDSPVELPKAIQFLASQPAAKIVAGGTDVGVLLNKRVISPQAFLDLNRIESLAGVAIENNTLVCGSRARWIDLEAICCERVPQFAEIMSIFGSPQIRHVGTIGGNIVNASPIADSLPFLFVADAELELAGPQGTRTVNINNFYHGYRQTDLQPGELLTRVRIPLPTAGQKLALYKVSRRRDLDIATFTAAILLEPAGDEISAARIALGAVGPKVLRARKTEVFLQGKPLAVDVMRAAGEIAAHEVTPITDVRGAEDFRRQLTRNVFLKFFYEAKLRDGKA